MSPAPIGIVCATAGQTPSPPAELIPRVKAGFS
jgi:hypothetical protein